MMTQFFIGCSPSQAANIINPDFPAAGAMVSVNQLRKRKSDFEVDNWIMDSGAFTEISKYGEYRYSVEEYLAQIKRWAKCGNILAAVAQDWMCEPFVLNRTGLSISEHQRLTIERYKSLLCLNPPVTIMPVLQGYQVSDYLKNLYDYGPLIGKGFWVGVGSVCRRNGSPGEIVDILRSIKMIRPDLRLHGFGLKQIALENATVRELLYSCDSMAWSYPLRFAALNDSAQYRPPVVGMAYDYQEKIDKTINGKKVRRIPKTAGAGNGQGRKPHWRNMPTVPIRVPEKFADKLLEMAKELDNS